MTETLQRRGRDVIDRSIAFDPADDWGARMLIRLSRALRFNTWMADQIVPFCGDAVLEIGAGVGNVTVRLLPRRQYVATDVNPLYLDRLARLADGRSYFSSRYCDVTDPATFPSQTTFDTVVCLNVLEHLDDDVAALANIRRVVAPRGHVIALVPNGAWNFGALDKALGHRRRYSDRRLHDLAAAAGFKIERVLKFNRASTPAWFLNGNLLRRRTVGSLQIALLDLLTPLLRTMDPWLPLPPLSLIAVMSPDHSVR